MQQEIFRQRLGWSFYSSCFAPNIQRLVELLCCDVTRRHDTSMQAAHWTTKPEGLQRALVVLRLTAEHLRTAP